jgi:cell division protein FtsN
VRALRLASATAAQAGAASGEAATLAPAALPLGPASSAGAAAPAAATGAESGGGRALPGEAAQADDAIVTPALPTETGARAGYGIQLGAFGSEASADREWQRLQVRFAPELGSLSPRIVPAESDSRQLYRLQVAASGEAQARALCDTLREQAQACIPVVPR